MPTYEYRCSACEHSFEKEQKITEAPIKKCPKCAKLKAERVISAVAFTLKGGGWYNEGYARAPPKKVEKKTSGTK